MSNVTKNDPREAMEKAASAPSPQEQPQQEALLAGKYHSVEALEQGYKELSRLVREKAPEMPEAPEIPEQYTVDLSDTPALETYNLQEDALWQHMTPIMKEAALTQTQAETVTKAFMHYQLAHNQKEQEAFTALGKEGVAMAKQVDHFISKNFKGNEAEVAYGVASSVEGLKFLQKVASLAYEQPIPQATQGSAPSKEDLKAKALSMLKEPDMAYSRQKQEAYNKIWQDITR